MLYKVRKTSVSIYQLLKGKEDVFSENELEVILEDLYDKGIVSVIPANDSEGAELPFLRYRLTSAGISLFEDTMNQKEESKALPDSKQENLEQLNEHNNKANPYPRIFKNHNSFLLFEKLRSQVRERYLLADYSFIYRRMQKDGYIYISLVDSEFRGFLSDYISISIEKTKLLDYCTTIHKETNYSITKNLFKPL